MRYNPRQGQYSTFLSSSHAFLERNDKIMKGGTRKRGKTWSYYFDLGKIDGKRQKKE